MSSSLTAVPAGAMSVPARGEHPSLDGGHSAEANPFCSHISSNQVSAVVGRKMVFASASVSAGPYGALCVYGSHVFGTPGGSMVQIEVGQVAKDAFASLAGVEETFKGMLRDPKFTPEPSLGTTALHSRAHFSSKGPRA